jgi:hypothetical protein
LIKGRQTLHSLKYKTLEDPQTAVIPALCCYHENLQNLANRKNSVNNRKAFFDIF